MALVNYMGNAPGFMSYQRQRSTQPLTMPGKYKRTQTGPAASAGEYDFNPGDTQWLTDSESAFNTGIQQLYSEYGGEMDWVKADPRYRQLVATQKNNPYNVRSATRNQEETNLREETLNATGNGQQHSDYELQYIDGAWMMKNYIGRNSEGKLVGQTKGEYLNEVISTPQLTQHSDGSLGLGVVDFDKNSANEARFNSLVGAFLTDTGDHSWARADTKKQDLDPELVGKYQNYYKLARSGASNWEQLNDATQYLIEYGFDTEHEYFLAQEMHRDYINGRSFKMPKVDENGDIVRDKKTGRPKLERYTMTEEDMTDPSRVKFLSQFYMQDRIEKYAKKYLKTASTRDEVTGWQDKGRDPRTGKPLVDPHLAFWQNVARNEGPIGKGYSTKVTDHYWNADGELVSGDVVQSKENPFSVIYNDGNAGVYMDRAREELVGSKLSDLVKDGKVNVDGYWTELDAKWLDELIVADVGDVTLRRGADGKNTWVGGLKFVVDEDTPLMETGFNFYDATENEVKKSSYQAWTGRTKHEAAAENQGILRTISDEEVTNAGYIVSGMTGTGWDLAGESDDYLLEFGVDVTTLMPMFDQHGVGESERAKSDKAFVGAMADYHNRGLEEAETVSTILKELGAY
jgi:hypothetical protein